MIYGRCCLSGRFTGVRGGQKKSGTEDDDGKMSTGKARGEEAYTLSA